MGGVELCDCLACEHEAVILATWCVIAWKERPHLGAGPPGVRNPGGPTELVSG